MTFTQLVHRLSLTRKLTAIGVVTSTVSLVVAGVILMGAADEAWHRLSAEAQTTIERLRQFVSVAK